MLWEERSYAVAATCSVAVVASRQQRPGKYEQGKQHHVHRRAGEDGVECAALPDAPHPAPCEDVGQGVEQRQHRRHSLALDSRCDGDEHHARQPEEQVECTAEAFARQHDDGALAAQPVGIHVAEVVDDEQSVDDQAARRTVGDGGGRDRPRLQVVGADDWHEPEEHQHQHVPHAAVGHEGRVEEREDDARRAHGDEPPSAIAQEQQPEGAGHAYRDGYGRTHGTCRHPSACAGPPWPEAVLAVSAAQAVEQVVDEIGRHLHRECEDEAQHHGLPLEASVADAECHARDDWHGGCGKRLGTCGKHPGARRVGFHSCLVHVVVVLW